MVDATTITIPDQAIVARRAGMIDSEIDGELVGLHLDSGNCYGFNATATRIWALIEKPMAFGSVCAALCQEFEVDGHTCRSDTALLVSQLVREGLAEISAEG